ncbi:NUDIX domain-containing protein [Amycolatopsis anabasis]|uniref:NUDIX domain-containing protein n=1 Tax=Amycolatopsis anabasis TaxID=1840409 RepID=UPI00131BB532|nr:NUDIX hydrolase [Amycolatopsis anabasis]
MPRENGGGFVRCACGHRHWGLHGAAGLLLTDPARGVLLQRRAWWTHHGRTWALPGGAVHEGESAWQAATREAEEEAAVRRGALRPTAESIVDHGTWRYTTVLATARLTIEERATSIESAELRWVDPDEVADYKLHRDFATAWPDLRAQLDRELVVVVDGANVVGSRPDGWWRDRAGAAARLRDRLAGLAGAGVPDGALGLIDRPHWSWWPRVVLVVEGQARGTAAVDGVEVVSAARDGDSAIVATARAARADRPGDHVVVVTADRELRTRVEAEGATVRGPATLLNLLAP